MDQLFSIFHITDDVDVEEMATMIWEIDPFKHVGKSDYQKVRAATLDYFEKGWRATLATLCCYLHEVPHINAVELIERTLYEFEVDGRRPDFTWIFSDCEQGFAIYCKDVSGVDL